MKKENIFWGLFFIVAAVLLIVGRFGVFQNINVWSILISVFFVAWLVRSVARIDVGGILFSIAFLCIVYAKPLGITAITPWPVLGAALFGSIGFSFIFPHHHSHEHRIENFDSMEEVRGNTVDCATTFGSSVKYINSDDLSCVNVDCNFGAMKIYFDNATIQSGRAVLDMKVSFAGIELYVPKTWNIENNVNFSFGGMEEKNRSESSGTPTLVLQGSVSFAGVTVLYV